VDGNHAKTMNGAGHPEKICNTLESVAMLFQEFSNRDEDQ
jgi:hypothetical protein